MSLDSPTTVTAALALGAAGSLHCFVMCGPLACAARGSLRAASAYHLARIAGYAAVGALLGGVGSAVHLPLQSALPWLLALVLFAAVIDPGGRRLRKLPPLPGIAQLLRLLARVRASLSPTANAALLGAVTPLLPCGLLYGIALSAIASSSLTTGALLMSTFALGALPALALAQLSTRWTLQKLPARLIQRALPLTAAVVLVYRALAVTAHHSCH